MLKVLGRPNSINVQKVMWALGELGLEHEVVMAGGEYGQVDEAWYLAMNPNGRVPVIDDGGFVLYESNAIVRYLAELHGQGSLEPDDAAGRGLADQWMDWQQSVLAPAMFACAPRITSAKIFSWRALTRSQPSWIHRSGPSVCRYFQMRKKT